MNTKLATHREAAGVDPGEAGLVETEVPVTTEVAHTINEEEAEVIMNGVEALTAEGEVSVEVNLKETKV